MGRKMNLYVIIWYTMTLYAPLETTVSRLKNGNSYRMGLNLQKKGNDDSEYQRV